MRGMRAYITKSNVRARDSLQWHVWYAWNVGVVEYKVQCGHAGSWEWNVIHYANNTMLTDRSCVPPLPPYGARDGRVRVRVTGEVLGQVGGALGDFLVQ